jgi:hypothetical protein
VVQGGGTKSIKGTVGELFLPGKRLQLKGHNLEMQIASQHTDEENKTQQFLYFDRNG